MFVRESFLEGWRVTDVSEVACVEGRRVMYVSEGDLCGGSKGNGC